MKFLEKASNILLRSHNNIWKIFQLTSRVEFNPSLLWGPKSFFIFSLMFSFLSCLKVFSWSHRAMLNRRSGLELWYKTGVKASVPQPHPICIQPLKTWAATRMWPPASLRDLNQEYKMMDTLKQHVPKHALGKKEGERGEHEMFRRNQQTNRPLLSHTLGQ